jgi:hypothetical protein
LQPTISVKDHFGKTNISDYNFKFCGPRIHLFVSQTSLSAKWLFQSYGYFSQTNILVVIFFQLNEPIEIFGQWTYFARWFFDEMTFCLNSYLIKLLLNSKIWVKNWSFSKVSFIDYKTIWLFWYVFKIYWETVKNLESLLFYEKTIWSACKLATYW